MRTHGEAAEVPAAVPNRVEIVGVRATEVLLRWSAAPKTSGLDATTGSARLRHMLGRLKPRPDFGTAVMLAQRT